MIICDVDNVTGPVSRPTQEKLLEEWRKQTEAIKDVRRRLRETLGREARPVRSSP